MKKELEEVLRLLNELAGGIFALPEGPKKEALLKTKTELYKKMAEVVECFNEQA